MQTLSGHVNDVMSVAFSPDGELVAAGSLGQTIRIWRLATGRVIKTLWFNEISWHPVVFSPRGQWLALASRDVQLWLKAMLTEEEFAEVKAGEERAMLMKQETDAIARELAELKRLEKEEAAFYILMAQRRAAGECELCGTRLGLARRRSASSLQTHKSKAFNYDHERISDPNTPASSLDSRAPIDIALKGSAGRHVETSRTKFPCAPQTS